MAELKAAPTNKQVPREEARPLAKAAPRPGRKGMRKGKGTQLARRSPESIAATVAKIVALVATEKGGLRAEQIRATLGLPKAEFPRPIQEALAKNLLRRKGVKRATTYFAV